jgi:N-acyl-D-amino-acid deacylase
MKICFEGGSCRLQNKKIKFMHNKKSYYIPFVLLLSLFSCQPESYDIIIRNGQVLDGSRSEAFTADIGIRSDKIVKVKARLAGTAEREIDASGHIVSPGFIDLHAHLEPMVIDREAQSHVRQGVTFALGGPDGGGPLRLGNYLDSLEAGGIGMNVGYLIGHNTIRNEVLGMVDREPTPEELEAMKALVQEAMDDGAFGISTGLKYLPGTWAKLDEIVALSKVAGQNGGIYTSHLREEGLQLLGGVQEAIDIADQADIPVVLTHHKVVGFPMWGSSTKTLAMVDSARAAGLDVMIDQYPYTASHTNIGILIPSWAMEGGRYDKFAERCQDPVLRDSIKRGIIFNLINDRGGNDLKRVQFSRFNWKPELEGQTLYDWAVSEGMEPSIENGAELVIQAQLHRGANGIFHAMSPEDVERIMQHPQTMIASDGRLSQPGKGHPHPRAYGTFPIVLGEYTREKGVLDLPTAVYKMTGLPAQRLGFQDRGLIKEGYTADITIFDPETVNAQSTFEAPHQYPAGIPYVMVNGQLAVDEGVYKPILAGKVIKRMK